MPPHEDPQQRGLMALQLRFLLLITYAIHPLSIYETYYVQRNELKVLFTEREGSSVDAFALDV